jgi:hypothetical protein
MLMSDAFKPKGRPNVVPRIITEHVAEQAAFITAVFGAAGELQTSRPTQFRCTRWDADQAGATTVSP